ncbi:hypothetical protein BDV95DRAFT_67191 [Massariosphaeria phaeospora]|uniref:Homeodomain-like protein n=1 Tax=Massariosphaeria phaeospora TaxID=100035 RepID=A0A7C8I8F3_9PLEO|nr:hypothetical protein BDV95DRAFT_67191 [Massariosphaeria phaeospora]
MLAKSTGRQPRKWTVTEDQTLREEVEAQMSEGEVKDWCRVANALPGRTNKDCRKRWFNSVAGGLKKGQWSKSEDLQLARGVQQYGQRWTQVAQVVSSRSADQCAKRWQQSLDPELDRSEWRESEDSILLEAVQTLGRHWKDIQRQHFPGRSKNCIKNRYTVLLRRYQNQGITLPEAAGTPDSTTAADDDAISNSPCIYDELLATHTHVSTPETHASWSLDEQPFTSWSQESYNITPTASSYQQMQPQYAPPNVSSAPHWSWSTTSLQAPQMSTLIQPNAYSNTLDTPSFASYTPYTPVTTMAPTAPHHSPSGHRISFTNTPVRAPTSSPRTSMYQDPDAMTSYMTYGPQYGPPYQYQ